MSTPCVDWSTEGDLQIRLETQEPQQSQHPETLKVLSKLRCDVGVIGIIGIILGYTNVTGAL